MMLQVYAVFATFLFCFIAVFILFDYTCTDGLMFGCCIVWWDAGVVMCLGQGADLHVAQLMPLPLTISCSVNPDWFYLPGFTFLVPAHPASPRQNPRGP